MLASDQLINNTQQFRGLWAVILGGSSGFGLASVEKLAAHGMNVAVLYREPVGVERPLLEKLRQLATNNRVEILPGNINALEEGGRLKFVETFKAAAGTQQCVRLLLHSIARGNLKPLNSSAADAGEGLTADDVQLTTYAMSNSLLDWVRLLIKESLFCADARVVGLTSEGANKYWDGYAAVSIAKASLKSLVTYMAVEFAPLGIKTNLVQAGVTETPSLKRIPGSDKLLQYAQALNPSGRITQPADVANVIYLLCSDEAAWINGALIHVDGGEHCR